MKKHSSLAKSAKFFLCEIGLRGCIVFTIHPFCCEVQHGDGKDIKKFSGDEWCRV
jgi:hypothetical protein